MQELTHPLPDDFASLRLSAALRLLKQSGRALPEPREVEPSTWLQALVDGLCELSSRDALTGLANRRHFELALAGELDRVGRGGDPALLLMIDIDHFKQVNDDHGHVVGDAVLQAVARTLLDCIRPMDTLARFGGEEFALILPKCPPAFGRAVAERLRARVANRSIIASAALDATAGPAVRVTISVGGAFAPPGVRSAAPEWIAQADRQLYRAKADGRNCVCLEPPGPPVADEAGVRRAWPFEAH